ncbi:MAG TPA: ATP-grasp domain-containing protein [Xanthobacteraceae bacterium]|nr:ATP-grasp domain-containing protein [Xanthobacteraceae bacterium]
MGMILLEYAAKVVMAERGIRVARGALVRSTADLDVDFAPPMMVKAQVPVGGRGKAGGVIRAADATALAQAVGRLTGTTIKGGCVDALSRR